MAASTVRKALFLALALVLFCPLASRAQIVFGVVPSAGSAAPSPHQAGVLGKALGAALGEQVQTRVFSDQEQLLEWMLRYRMVDLALLDRQTVLEHPDHPFFDAGEIPGSEEVFAMRPGTPSLRLDKVRQALKSSVITPAESVSPPPSVPATSPVAAGSPEKPSATEIPVEVPVEKTTPPLSAVSQKEPQSQKGQKKKKKTKEPAKRVSRRDEDKRLGFDAGKYSLEGQVGFGYDSNVYLAPDSPYLDPFAKEAIHPDRKSGFFVPVEVDADFSLGSSRLRWVSAADFDGQFYTETVLNNADNHSAGIDTGVEMLLHRKGKDKTTFYIGPTLAYNKKIYFDRDTGIDKGTLSSQKAMSNRYNYFCRGLEAEIDGRLSDFEYTVEGKIAEYDYEEVDGLSSLDYRYWRAEAELEYPATKSTTAGLYYKYYVNDYHDRQARNLEGRLLDENPELLYRYRDVGLYLEQNLGKNWLLSLEYDYLVRDDDFVGYNDYSQDRYTLAAEYGDRKKRELDLEVVYWEQNYPNAYAFDKSSFTKSVLAAGDIRVRKKVYRAWEASLTGEYPLWGPWLLWMEQTYIDQYSSDPRYDYHRYQAMAGLKFDY